MTSWVRRAEDDLGPVQAVVSCAGITRDQPLALLEDADWRAVIDTSLDGVFHLCRAVLRAMMERQAGRIVTVSSVSAVYGDACRAFLRARGRRGPGRDRGVHQGTGQPDRPVRHPGQRDHARREHQPDLHDHRLAGTAATARLTEAIAIRRFASAAEAADRVAFLLSDAAADITGTVVEMPGSIGCRRGPGAGSAGLHPVEGLGVAERAAHRRPVGGEQPDLEVRLPAGHAG